MKYKISIARHWLLFGSLALILSGCTSGKDNKPDISAIPVEWKLVPFHLEMKPSQEATYDEHMAFLRKEYPAFSDLYFGAILPLGDDQPERPADLLYDPGLQKLVDTCVVMFGGLNDTKNVLNNAFKYYSHYFGESKFPDVYTFVSGFAYQTFVFQDGEKDGLGIGLDMFLGDSFPYKSIDPNNPSFSEYLTYFFDEKYMARKILFAWLDDKVPLSKGSDLLDVIIRNGKLYYILERLIPSATKDVILEYRPEEYAWCMENEIALWSHLLKEDLLYESNFKKINKLINPSPGARGIPSEAPGGVANYIGWRIVQSYMQKTGVSMTDMLNESDAQNILEISKYKPRDRAN